MLVGAITLWAHFRAAPAAPPARVVPATTVTKPAPSADSNGPKLAGLRPDACQLFAPTAGDRHLTVFVDPGHGGVDPGALGAASSGEVQEKDVTLAVGLELLERLRSDGYSVAMSRTTDATVAQLGPNDTDENGLTQSGEHRDTQARIQCANARQAKLMIAIHLNSFFDPSAGGAETIYDAEREFSDANERFAGLVQSSLVDSFARHGWAVPDRGIKDDSSLFAPVLSMQAGNYGHLLELGPSQSGWLDDPSRMPGALTEPLFVTDRGEANLAVSGEGQAAMAEGIQQAINGYFDGGATAAKRG